MAFDSTDRAKLNWLVRKVQDLEQILLGIQQVERYELMWLDDFRTEIAHNTSVTQGVVETVHKLADKLQQVIDQGSDPVELQALVDQLKTNDGLIADAIAANTPADPTAAPPPEPAPA